MQDHDLLIRLDTKVDVLGREMASARLDANGRTARLETGKVDKEDFIAFKQQLELDKQRGDITIERMFTDYKKLIDERFLNGEQIMKGNSADIKTLSRFMWTMGGGLVVLQILVPVILRKLGF